MKLFFVCFALLVCINLSKGQLKEVKDPLQVEVGSTESKDFIRVWMDNDSAAIHEIDIAKEAKNAYIKAVKSVRDIALDKGAIVLSATVEQYECGDSAHAEIFLEGFDARNKSVVSQLSPLDDLLNGKAKGKIQIVLPYEVKLESIRVLIRSFGHNAIKIKNLQVQVDGWEQSNTWQSTILPAYLYNQELIRQLAVLGKTWGLLKYFAPDVSAAGTSMNWDRVLMNKVDLLLQEPGKDNFNKIIHGLLVEAGLSGQLHKQTVSTVPLDLTAPADSVNIDYTWIDDNPYLEVTVKRKLKNLVRHYAVFKNKFVTTPEQDETLPSPVFHEQQYNKNFLQPLNLRLLALFRYWNIINYYYPYKQHIKDRFEDMLLQFIPEFIAANTTKKYGAALVKLNASIDDGHAPFPTASFYLSSFLFKDKINIYPFTIKVDSLNNACIDKIDTGFAALTGLRKKDKLLAVNGHGVASILDTLNSGLGASRPAMRPVLLTKYHLLSFLPQPTDSLKLTLRRAGIVKAQSFKYGVRDFKKYGMFIKNEVMTIRPAGSLFDSTHFIAKGLLYINPQTFKMSDSTRLLSRMRKSKNVIIDCRAYPSAAFLKIASWFLKDKMPYVKYQYAASYPGLLKSVIVKSKKISDYDFPGNLIVLISSSTVSRSELLTMLLQARGGKVVTAGSTTVGADGDVTTVPMIGEQGMTFRFSGLRVLYPDGRDTHGIGILPDYNFAEKDLIENVSKALEMGKFPF